MSTENERDEKKRRDPPNEKEKEKNGKSASERETIEEALTRDGVLVKQTKGVSMLPFLKEGRDTVVLVPNTGTLKKYDVALYRRGNDYVLHRVVGLTPNGPVMLGDHCAQKEYDVRYGDVLAVLQGVYRDGKYLPFQKRSGRARARIRLIFYPLRRAFVALKRLIKKIFKKNA